REEPDELAPRRRQPLVVGPDVTVVARVADDAHAAVLAVPLEHGGRVVGGRVIDDDRLQRRERLAEQAVQRLAEVVAVVVGGDHQPSTPRGSSRRPISIMYSSVRVVMAAAPTAPLPSWCCVNGIASRFTSGLRIAALIAVNAHCRCRPLAFSAFPMTMSAATSG